MDNPQVVQGGWPSVRPFRPAPLTLLALASVAVAGLMALSEFQPARVAGLGDLDERDPGEVSVVVARCRPCSGGYLLNLTDGEGGWADAFCPTGVCPSPLSNGTSARLVLSRSAEDPDFLYVQKVTVVAAPTGNL